MRGTRIAAATIPNSERDLQGAKQDAADGSWVPAATLPGGDAERG